MTVTVLVTGATGLVGNAIVRRLLERGDQVRALVREPGRARGVVPAGVELVEGDLTDADSVRAAVDGADLVFHAGGPPEQWVADEHVFDRVHVGGTTAVCQAALDTGVRRVVLTSTMDVFAKDAQGRLREENLDPHPKHTAYERAKQEAERVAAGFLDRGLDLVWTNPGTVYGPSPSHTGLNQFFIRLLNGQAPLLPPGGVSVAYVDAVADGHLAAAERGVTGQRYLFGDRFVTNHELAAITVRVAGRGKVPPTAPAWLLKAIATVSAPLARTFGFTPLVAPGQLAFLLWAAEIDSSKAQRELGYEPVDLEDGVRRTLRDLQRQGLIERTAAGAG